MKASMQQLIQNQSFQGERPLFNSHNIKLINVQILEGESALKEGSNLECEKCNFFGMYPLWHITGGNIHDCHFDTRARAGIWYSQNFEVSNCQIDAPKMFRKLKDFKISNCNFTNAEETLWCCDNIELFKVKAINGNNFALDSHNFKVVELNLVSKYVFQNCSNITIKDSIIDSKDAFWETDNVIVENSILKGEYLGWHSRNLTLRNCKIIGTQPLCYADNLVIDNCSFDENCDLAFEDSTVNATINTRMVSIKNPKSGKIKLKGLDKLIIDEYVKAPNDCKIEIIES